MQSYKLEDFNRGWIIGNFDPSIFKTNYEIAIRYHKLNDSEVAHFHKRTFEVNIIASGKVSFTDEAGFSYVFSRGDICVIEPFEKFSFTSLADDTIVVVVKTASNPGDKYE